MFDVIVTAEQRQYAQNQVNTHNFGMRGRGDGNSREQLTGIIGQTVFADLIGADRPDGSTGFDGGVDFNINGRTVDIKTMTRKVAMRDYFVHNFVGYQMQYDVDYYVFASLNTSDEGNYVLTICGYIDKPTFKERADFFEQGSWRERSDGTKFQTKAPLYEIKQTDLYAAGTLQELINGIKSDK